MANNDSFYLTVKKTMMTFPYTAVVEYYFKIRLAEAAAMLTLSQKWMAFSYASYVNYVLSNPPSLEKVYIFSV